MKKLTILAALLMTTSYAYAGGNSVSFEIDGHKIRIEAPQAAGITTPRSR